MLDISHLSVAYGRRRIVPDLTVEGLKAGEVTALLGPNGSGKSTTLKALAGLSKMAGGEIRLDGDDIARLSLAERAQRVVYLPQALPPAVHLQVFESVLVAGNASNSGHQGALTVDTVYALLTRLGIAHLALQYLDQLSGGQKQLVGLAQALVRQPRLLLLDEPLSALDLNYQFHVMDLLRQETRERNMITVIVLHDINIALRHTDHVVMIRRGELVAHGKPTDVITPATLAEVYGVRGRVEPCSQGLPQVMIDGLVAHDDGVHAFNG